jgi:hypothetical protein
MMLEKLENCPDCRKDLDQAEYDLQLCRTCGTTMGFHKTEKAAPFDKAYPAPWRMQLDEVVDVDGCHINGFDSCDADEVEFWRGIIQAVNARQLRREESCPGHVASEDDPKVCGRCGLHIDELRPPEEDLP